ncbi:hypothetical protein VTG60DRAFT_3769 [Thermothelomyces hinnuleus]
MFLSRASGGAGRLSGIATWAALRPRVPDAHPFVFANQGRLQRQQGRRQQQQQRDYAVFLRPRSKRPPPDAADGLPFKNVDPPPLHWWREFQEARGMGDLTPENCLSAFTQYCLVAANTGSSWKSALERDYNIDPYTLHYTALPLLNRSGTPAMMVGMHMLFTASSMGYTPSILTLMGILVRSPENVYAKARVSPSWRELDARFKRLLQTEKNPDAFTLQGLLLLREGKGDVFALRYFDRAVEAARDMPGTQPGPAEQDAPTIREPRWTLEAFCHRNRGALLLKQNRREEAMAAFRILALELDLPDGYAELAKMLPPHEKERETYLLKAAQGGSFEACELLALHMADKAADSDLPHGDRAVAAGLAREWALIEPDDAKREQVLAQVAERTRAVSGGR